MLFSRSLFALLLCVTSFYTVCAQLTVFGGPQSTSAGYSINGVKQETESKPGFAAGVGIKTVIEGPVHFAPQLWYSQKGYRVSFNRPSMPPDSGAVNNNATIHALELAPLVQINFSKKANYLFLRLGPSLDFNLSGRERFDSANGKSVSRSMTFSFADYSFVTAALNTQLGFQHKSGLTLFAYYNYGFGSLNNSDYGPKIFHRIAGAALGWKLGKKK